MIETLKEIIENQEIVDIYLDIENNGDCILTYKTFQVVSIDIKNNMFSGYRNEDRIKTESDRIITEDNIDLICTITRPSEL